LLNRPSFAEAGLSDFKKMKNNPMQSIDAAAAGPPLTSGHSAPPLLVSHYELA
jgi:hypothetical protein